MTRLNEIATKANSELLKKINKTEAFDTVLDLINTGAAPDEYQLAKLYSYFLPPLPAKPKTSNDWVQKAVAENGKLTAIDGHRLHIGPATGVTDGFYDKQNNRVEVDGKFPDIERVIPAYSAKDREVIDLSDLSSLEIRVTVPKVDSKPLETYILNDGDTSQNTVAVKVSYLKQALSNPSPLVRATIGAKSNRYSALRLDFEDGSIAVVMPIRV